MSEEIWRPINNLEGLYEISNYGRVKSLPKKRFNGRVYFISKEKILKERMDGRGYVLYMLYKDKKQFHLSGHRLVAIHFIKNPLNLAEVNHKDLNKTNNFYKNLEWVSHAQNIQHAHDNIPLMRPEAERNGHFKGKIFVYDEDGNHIDTLIGNKDMESKGYHSSGVCLALNGKLKTHKKCFFKRENISEKLVDKAEENG